MTAAPEANAPPPLVSLLNYLASKLVLLIHKFSSGSCFALVPSESIRPPRRALSAYCISISPDLVLPPVNRVLGSTELEIDRRYFLRPSTEGRVLDGPYFPQPQADTFTPKEVERGTQAVGKGVYGPSATTAREDRVRQAINKTASSRGGPPLRHTPLQRR